MTQEATQSTLPPGSVSVLPTQISAEQLHNWLQLLLVPGLGANPTYDLLVEFGDATRIAHAVQNDSDLLTKKFKQSFMQQRHAELEKCLAWLATKADRYILCWNDPAYPLLLKQINDPPLLLFIEGQPDILHQPQIAMVGSRKATPVGLETTRDFARALVQQGFTITSGLALGIDASAHIGALDGNGRTIAVLGNGLDKIYPARHQALAEDIISKNGALVSEFIPGTPPLAKNFPRRNRIISGLSVGVLVIEAAVRSGSLITARLAGEQGREVFAMPGSIHNPLSRGSHKLIREGAVLVEKIEDILFELPGSAINAPSVRTAQKTGSGCPNPEQQWLLENMGYDPVDTDTLVARSGLTAEQVSSMLLLLELQGSIAAIGGGRFQRCDI